MVARRIGMLSPWQDQPEICSAGSSIRLTKPRQDPVASLGSHRAKQGKGAEFAVDDAGRLQIGGAFGRHAGGKSRIGIRVCVGFAPEAIDFQFGHRSPRRVAPADDFLAAPVGMPEYFVTI